MRLWDLIDNWGSTADERASSYDCDGLMQFPDGVLFRAVSVDASAETVFRWLCQIKVAPYSYDWIDNLGRRSPRHLIPGLDHLETGQRFASIFRLTAFEPDRSITLESRTLAFGHVAVTYKAVATSKTTCRLVAKLLYDTPQGPFGWLAAHLLPAGDLVMMRKQLLTIKELAEQAGDYVRS